MLVALDEPRSEPLPEEVTPAGVLLVERLGVDAVEPLHAGGQEVAGSGDDQVVVVGHQAERLAPPFVASNAGAEERNEPEVVVVVEVDPTPLDPACGDVEGSVFGEDRAGPASHRVERRGSPPARVPMWTKIHAISTLDTAFQATPRDCPCLRAVAVLLSRRVPCSAALNYS